MDRESKAINGFIDCHILKDSFFGKVDYPSGRKEGRQNMHVTDLIIYRAERLS